MVSVTGGADPRPAPEIESKLDGAGMRSDSFCQDYVPAALNPIAAHLRARNPGLVF